MKHILTLLLTFLFVTVAIAQEEKVMKSNPVVTITGHLIKETPSLRNLKFTKHFKPVKVRDEDGIIGMEEDGEEEGPNHKKFPTTQNFTEDPAIQKQFPNYSHGAASRAVGANFDGMPYQPLNPPDPSLCVGPNHVIQMINGSGGALLKVYNKTGGEVIAQTYLSALTGLQGGGDPIALYDQGADRFILTEFAPPSTTNNGLIVAISSTNDPAGAWKVYYYPTGTVLADYPKYSVWNNAYYATTNDFSGGPNWSYIGSAVYAFDRAGMLAGNTSVSMQKFNMGDASKHYSMSPVSWQGTTEPVSGTGGLIAYMQDDTWTGSVTDSIGLFEFKVNFTDPSLSAVIQRASLAVAANKADVCDADRGKCIPQPGTSTKLEALAQRVMNQPIYRNFGSYEGIVLTYTVDKGSAIAAPRWYELTKTGSTWSVYQQSTYSPDNTHRWMSAICYDAAGNIGLVYNVSDGTTTYPGIRYAGRKRCDLLNIMSYEENVIIAGTASNGSSRYGDYSQLVCDPDGVRFWMTAEYNASSTWSTRISSFTLGGTCPIGEPASQTICSGDNIITINLSDNGSGTTYSWSRDNTVEVTGIAANGTGDIFGLLNNTTNAPVTVTFTITPITNSTAGTPFTVTVLVNPTPNAVATASSQTKCSGDAITTIALSGNVSGTTYSWTRDKTSNVTGISASGTGDISGTLTNSFESELVSFTIIPTANGCAGAPFIATVQVNSTSRPTSCPANITVNNDLDQCGASVGFNIPALPFACSPKLVLNSPDNNGGFSGPNGLMFDVTNTGNKPISISSINSVFINNLSQKVKVYCTGLATSYSNVVGNLSAWILMDSVTFTGAGLLENIPVRGLTLLPGQTKGLCVVADCRSSIRYNVYNSTVPGPSPTVTDGTLSMTAGVTCNTNLTLATGTPGSIINFRQLSGSINYIEFNSLTETNGWVTGSVYPVGTTTLEYTAVDINGASSNCSFDITVVDSQKPTITCPGAITVSVNTDQCTYQGSLGTVIANDNCSATITRSPSGNLPLGTTLVTWTATDPSGNAASCTQSVTVNPQTLNAGPPSSMPTLCINTALSSNITHSTTGAVGIANDGVAGTNGLPPGVSASWSSNIITISGTPTASGTFNYSILLTDCFGKLGTVSARGTITVNGVTGGTVASDQNVCDGGDPAAFTQTTPSTGGGALTYQWQSSTVSCTGDFNNIAGATGNTYDAPAGLLITTYYHRVTTNTLNGVACAANSNCITVVVNPTPNAVATPSSQTKCSADAITTIALSGNVSGTTYSWTRDNTGSVTGIASSGTGNISGTLTNTTNAPVTVTFTITPTANGCTGTPITATVVVNPTPNAVATPSSQTKCSGNAITTIALSGNVSGTTYNWTRDNALAATGIATSGTGDISGTLTNTTKAPVTVTFTITPTANGCVGTPITATVVVNPTPTADAPADVTVCGQYTLPALTAGNYFTGTGGTGTAKFAGDVISSSQTLYVYAQSGTNPNCTDEHSFNITVNSVTGGNVFSDIWVASTNYPINILDEATASVGNYLYSFGGVSNYAAVSNSYKFDGTVWTPIAPLPVELEFPTAVSDGTNIYILGGFSVQSGIQTTMYRYNVAANNYTLMAPFSTAVWNHAVVYYLNNKIYKFCGTSNQGSSNQLEIYDVSSDTWSLGAPYPIVNSFVSASVIGNYIYGAGGLQTSGIVSTLNTYRYDPASNSWDDAAIADLPQTRWGAASCLHSSSFIMAGGYVNGIDPSNISTSVISWDPVSNTWTELPNMLAERARMAGAILNGNFYVIGGRSIASSDFYGTNSNQKLIFNDVCSGGDPAAFTEAKSSTGTGTLSYQWQSSTIDCSNGFTDIPGATSTTYDPPAGLMQTTYYRRVTTSTLNGAISCSANSNCITVVVNPTPNAVATPLTQTKCSGDAITTIALSGNVSGTTYSWTRDNALAATGIATSGTGDISGTLTNTTNAPVTVTFTITPTANGCAGTPITVTVFVNPTPDVTQPANQTICNGAPIADVNFTGSVAGTIFNWTNDNPSIGLAASGTEDIKSFTGTNTTNAPITATVTVTPEVELIPELLYYKFDGTGASIPNLALAPPAGTSTATIQGGQQQGSPGICGAGSLIGNGSATDFVNTGWAPNLGNNNWTMSFKTSNNTQSTDLWYILGAENTENFRCFTNGVAGSNNWILRGPFNDVLVTGGATIEPHTITFVYDNTLRNIKAYLDGILNNTVSQNELNLIGAGPFNIGHRGRPYTGYGLPNGGKMDEFCLFNRALTPAEVLRLVQCRPNGGCTGPSRTFTITVNPTPNAIATPVSQTKCSGEAITTIALSGKVIGTTYSWTRDNALAATGIAASGTGDISGTLTNTTNAPVTITFTITPTANGCLGTSITATVVVNPTPTVTATPSSQAVCSAIPITTIVLTGSVSGTVYNWTRNNTGSTTGIAANGSGNISGTLTNATYAPVTVTFTITPMANGCAGTPMTATVLLNPLTNTSNPGNQSIYALENTSYSVTATGGGPLTYKWQESTNGGTNFNNLTDGGVYSGTATNTLNLIAVPGNMNGYKYRCVVTSGCSVATSAAALLTVTKRPTTLTYTGDNSEQYSDQQLLTAVLKDQLTNTVLSSKTVSFTLGTQSVSDGPSAPGNGTDANGLASATLRMYQNPGNYTVASSFAGDVNYVSSTDSDPFRITKENAIADYTGPQFISVPCATCATTNVLLSASVRDTTAAFPLNDIYPGDIRKARVKFINLNTLTDISGWLTPALISTSDTTKGTVVFNWTVPIPSNSYDVYSIGVIVDSITNTSTGNYIGKAETVLSVSRAGLSEFISGGGNIIPTASAGQYASDAGLKTNFGFNVKFNRNYTNLQGNLNIIFRRSGRLYQIKATSMNSLSMNTTNPCAKQALFTSKANLIDITNPSAPISIYGGITLQVTMMDKGDQGNTDQIGVTLWNGSSLVYSSKWVTTQTVEMLLNGGNILIHSGANCTTTIIKTTNNQSVEQPAITNAKVYPNPFNKVTTISYNLPTEAQVSLAVYNIFGKKIAQLVEGKLPAGQYESKFDATKLISGFYFYRLESTDAQGKKVLLTGKMLNTK